MKRRELVKRRKYLNIVFVVTALLTLILNLSGVFSKDRELSEMENRKLQKFPEISLSQIMSGDFENKFEAYVADQFPFREKWLVLESTVSRMMGKTEKQEVILGKDGYLLQRFEAPTEAEYNHTLEGMIALSKVKDDVKTSVLVAPTAVSVLKNRMPIGTPTDDQNDYLDAMKTDLEKAGITFVDVRDAFNDTKKDTQLYYRTDHHWTTPGAKIAFEEYQRVTGKTGSGVFEEKMVSDTFKGTLSASSGFRVKETDSIYVYFPKEEVDYVVSYTEENEKVASLYATEKLSTRDQYGMFFNGNHAQIKLETDSKNQGTLLVVKDSYANCFVPFLIPEYKKIIMVDPRYYADDIEELIKAENVTELLFLYNANTLAKDQSLGQLISND